MRLAAFFLILPFFLQLLGFGETPLGGGLCGELFRGKDLPLALQPPGFWLGLLFMLLLAFQMGLGGLFLLLPLLEVRPSPFFLRLGRGVAFTLVLLFLLSRTLGLPLPSPQGLVLAVAPLDPLSLLIVASSALGGVLLRE
ncbi:hypothetical protein [Thermus filiformis]|uniref:Uncharacterized protein n=1 Tax=Thermus filiformis TaxID=276 RepID=A0A0A2WS13_THEFI|nr:hypothetical protein [Thermus filiformis]KGQ22588.1 hypothetical protein THFILI_04120 [Thermus filiformis]